MILDWTKWMLGILFFHPSPPINTRTRAKRLFADYMQIAATLCVRIWVCQRREAMARVRTCSPLLFAKARSTWAIRCYRFSTLYLVMRVLIILFKIVRFVFFLLILIRCPVFSFVFVPACVIHALSPPSRSLLILLPYSFSLSSRRD